jgi:hypothetical protein
VNIHLDSASPRLPTVCSEDPSVAVRHLPAVSGPISVETDQGTDGLDHDRYAGEWITASGCLPGVSALVAARVSHLAIAARDSLLPIDCRRCS